MPLRPLNGEPKSPRSPNGGTAAWVNGIAECCVPVASTRELVQEDNVMAKLIPARVIMIRKQVEAQPSLVGEIGRALGWQAIEVRQFLQGQFKAEADELKLIEFVLKGQPRTAAGKRY